MIKHKYLFDFGYQDENQKALIKKQAKLVQREPDKVLGVLNLLSPKKKQL
jgi:hypothetical protein